MSGTVHLLLGRLTFEGESALFILFIISVVVAMGTFACLAWYLLKFRSSIQWICIEGALEDVNFGVLGVRVSYNYEYEGNCFHSNAVSINRHRKYGALPHVINRLRKFVKSEEKIPIFIDARNPNISFLDIECDFWGVVAGIVIFALSIVVVIMYLLLDAGSA
mgnify:FL=1